MKFGLTCSSFSSDNSTCSSWVKYPEHLDLMYVSRHFLVAVDPTALPPGVHSAYVRAYDVSEPNKVSICCNMNWQKLNEMFNTNSVFHII